MILGLDYSQFISVKWQVIPLNISGIASRKCNNIKI
jgi:hypothetical protein